MNLCKCGCGQTARLGNAFIHGHNRQGTRHTDDEKRRIRETNIKTYSNPLLIEKFKGKNNPYFGMKHSGKIREVMQAKAQERCIDPAFIQKIALTTKAALSDPAKRKKINVNSVSMWKNGESREKLMKHRTTCFRDPVFVKKYRDGVNCKPNKPETLLTKLLESLYPGEWKYTGDFTFMVGGKCPDFVNCNGQKKIIELFGDYWHRGENPQDRIDMFKPFGFDTLVIRERELKNIHSLTERLERFCNHARE